MIPINTSQFKNKRFLTILSNKFSNKFVFRERLINLFGILLYFYEKNDLKNNKYSWLSTTFLSI